MALPSAGTGDTYTQGLVDGILTTPTEDWAFPAGGATVNCDLDVSNQFKFNAGSTLTVTTSNQSHGQLLLLTIVGGATVTVTLPTIRWRGSAPSLAIPANTYATLALRWDAVIDGGTWVEVDRWGFLPAWTAPTLGANIANLGAGWATAGYYKDAAGIVRGKGVVAGSGLVTNAVLFTLPAGFRPGQSRLVPSMSLSGSTWGSAGLNIGANGAVAISYISGTTALGIDFQFPAEL